MCYFLEQLWVTALIGVQLEGSEKGFVVEKKGDVSKR